MRSLFREKFFKKHYDKLVHSRSSMSRPSVNSVSSVTVLTDSRLHDTDELHKTLDYFRSMEMVCHIYLTKNKNQVVELTRDVHVIKLEDCEWYGVPSQEILISWLANKTDLLIVANPNNLLVMKYLCAASNSKLKTAITYDGKKIDDPFIEFFVDVDQKEYLPLDKQCKLIYSALSKIGIRPPVIG